MAALATPMP
jgi:hypothetical protein